MLREYVVPKETVAPLGFGRWAENLPLDSLMEVVSALTDRQHESTAIAILEHRLMVKPEEMPQWEGLALRLVTNRSLIRECSHHWHDVAKKLVSQHARIIANAIFHEQADRELGSWFSEYNSAADVLRRCADADASGVWDELVSYLSVPHVHSFAVGFAPGVVERLPFDRISQWVSEKVEERASSLAYFVSVNLSSDDTLAARLIGAFGDNERVASAFFAQYTTGSWSGEASAHWSALANRLTDVVNRTSLPKVRAWAKKAIESLRSMAGTELEREQEWDLRRQ